MMVRKIVSKCWRKEEPKRKLGVWDLAARKESVEKKKWSQCQMLLKIDGNSTRVW